MFVVTFYSYKGGVGRTLSLVNVAFRLASRGKRVFILDFDLEAPGVDAFSLFRDAQSRLGIVEYISAFTMQEKVEPLTNFVSEIDAGKTYPGRVFFMGAGRKDDNYQYLLSMLDWKSFYQQQKGFLFVENLKAAIEKEYYPDYVLVDSRTGLTDVAGICTLQLPDLDVLLFNLNNQNISGVSKIYKSIRSNQVNKEIKTLLVASPIPDVPDFVGVRKERLEYARQMIGANENDLLVLPFDAFVAFEETVLTKGMSKTSLSESYDNLCQEIISSNASDVLTMLDFAKLQSERGNLDLAELKFQEAVETNPSNPETFLERGKFLSTRGKRKEAIESFTKAHELNPSDPEALARLITTELGARQRDEALKYLEPFLALSQDPSRIKEVADALEHANASDAAIRAYSRALEFSDDLDLHLDIGNVYMRLGQPEVAVEHYRHGVEKAPTYLHTTYNYAYALSVMGDSRATENFRRAIELYEQQNLRRRVPTELVNMYQAISHAYRAVGDLTKARRVLNDALTIARKMPTSRPVFSSVQYRRITALQFIEETMGLLKKLDVAS